jgi:hypothetical protein
MRSRCPGTDALTNDKRVARRRTGPDAEAGDYSHHSRLAVWDANQMRRQLRLAQQDLARSRRNHTAAIAQAQPQVSDLDNRLRASTALERESSAGN